MPSENSCNMWVFREGRSTVRGQSLLDGVRAALRAASATRLPDTHVDVLLRAGEMECGLADAGSSYAPQAAEITDATAGALLELPGSGLALDAAATLLSEIPPPEYVNISPPEGFAYYAVHPLDFAALADGLPLHGKQA